MGKTTTKSLVKVASICMDSGTSSDHNIEVATTLIEKAAENGADWIVLPEMFTFMGPYQELAREALDIDSKRFSHFQSLCIKHKIILFLGTVAEKNDAADQAAKREQVPEQEKNDAFDKVFNTLFVIGRDGQILAKYRKTHLFSLISTHAENSYNEADGYLRGDSLVSLLIDGLRVHLAICFDLRFSEFFNALQTRGLCDVIVCPSAFTQATGKRHWHLLNQARACEYQCYVVASAQTGLKSSGKKNYGHALICDPWGQIIQDTGESVGIAFATIDNSKIEAARTSLPIRASRRQDLY